MVSISITKSGKSKRKYNNKAIKYVEFKATERLSRDEVVKVINKMIKNNKLDKTKKYILSGCWNTSGWRSGKVFNTKTFNINNIYDFNDKYNLEGHTQDLKNFVLYELDGNDKGGNDINNDCFYNALLSGLNQNQNLIPIEIFSPIKLKKYLNLKRNAMLSIDDIKKLLPLLLKNNISIQVENYINTEVKEHNITMTLIADHYELVKSNVEFMKTIKKSMLKYKEKSKYKRQLYSYFNEKETNKMYFYNGEVTEAFDKTPEAMDEIFLSSHKIFLKVSNKNELKIMREKYLKDAESLLKGSNNRIDILKYKDMKSCLKDLLLESINEKNINFDELDELEDKLLYEYYHYGGGGFVYHENGYEGEIFTVDANSAYPSTFNSKCNVPIGKPEFKTLKNTDLKTYISDNKECLSFSFGLFRANIEKVHDSNKYIRHKFNNWYTHDDLKHAQSCGLKVDLIEDNEINAMVYGKDKLVESRRIFDEFINELIDLKKKKVGGDLPKNMLNTMTGMLANKNKFFDYGHNPKVNDLKDVNIINIYPSHNGDDMIYTPLDKHFRFPLARCTVFLVSKFRCYIQGEIFKYKDNVVRCYSDSIGFDDEQITNKFNLGLDLMQWKKEETNYCRIANNRLTIKCECCNEFFNKTELRRHKTI